MNEIKKKIILVLGVILSVFLTYTSGFGQFSPMFQRGLPLMIAVVLVFLVYSGKRADKAWQRAINIVLILASIFAIGYVMYFQKEIAMRLGRATEMDVLVSIIGILVVLEITRRSTAPALAVISAIFLAYAAFGQYLPGALGHRELDLKNAAVYLFLSQEGIFGTNLDVMVTFVFIFMLFGAFLEFTGAGQAFINVAYGFTGKLTGGPALTAVVASSLFGMVSGSPVANVSGVGTFTIPLMKRTGYDKEFAAAVEATASTGGQIMPPVMGATAFLMAEILAMPYIEIAYRAIIPAFLFYLSLFLTVYLRARKEGLKGLPAEELPSKLKAVTDSGHMFLALIVLVAMLILNFSPAKSAFWGTVILIVTSSLRASSRLNLKKIFDALSTAAKQSLGTFAALACVGIIVGVVSLTGLGVKFSILVTSAAGSSLILALLLVAIAGLIMGMGLPPVAAYLLLIVIAGPALETLGAFLFTAHMFVFYFGAMAPITPPVALAAYTAAGISGGSPFRIGFISSRLALVGFIVPFMFIFSPELLMMGSIDKILIAFAAASLGVFLLAISLEGYFLKKLPSFLRVTTGIGAVALIFPGLITDALGLGLGLIMLVQQLGTKKVSVDITS